MKSLIGFLFVAVFVVILLFAGKNLLSTIIDFIASIREKRNKKSSEDKKEEGVPVSADSEKEVDR